MSEDQEPTHRITISETGWWSIGISPIDHARRVIEARIQEEAREEYRARISRPKPLELHRGNSDTCSTRKPARTPENRQDGAS